MLKNLILSETGDLSLLARTLISCKSLEKLTLIGDLPDNIFEIFLPLLDAGLKHFGTQIKKKPASIFNF